MVARALEDQAAALLRPGGHLVLAAIGNSGRGRDPVTETMAAAGAALVYVQHVVALLRADLVRLDPAAGGGRTVAHADVVVFAGGSRDGVGLARRPAAERLPATGPLPARVHAHPAKMLPALARRAIAAFSEPGDTVLDPMCGIGTTLVEAAHLGRDALGIEYEPRWAGLAQANLALARAAGAPGTGDVVVGDCRHLTSPPYGPSTQGPGAL